MQNADTTARKLTSNDSEAISRTPQTDFLRRTNTERIRLVSTYGKLYDDIIDDGFLRRLSHEALKIYLVLIRFANRDNVSWPSQATIGKRANLRKVAVSEAVTELVDLGLIVVLAQEPRKKTLYRVADRQKETGSQRVKTGSPQKPTGSQKNKPNQTKNASDGHESADFQPEPDEKPGTRTKGSLREPQQTGDVCCHSRSLDQRAERHTAHAMQIGRAKGWERSAVLTIMQELCKTHNDDQISWIIEHTGPDAKTPGLIRDVVLKKPTRAEAQATEQRQKARDTQKRQYYAEKPTPQQVEKLRSAARAWLDAHKNG